MKCFVYGTLLDGMSRCDALWGATFLGLAFARGDLYDLGEYPGLVPGDGIVYGELYAIDEDIRLDLDRIEGYVPGCDDRSIYLRRSIDVSLMKDGRPLQAEVYVYNRDLSRAKRIDHGDYRRHHLESEYRYQWFIAYGADVGSERILDRIGEPLTTIEGYLVDHRLVSKKSGPPPLVYENIEYAGPGHRCPAVAYEIPRERLRALDRLKAEPPRFVRLGLPLHLPGSSHSRLGHVYLAAPCRRTAVPEATHRHAEQTRTDRPDCGPGAGRPISEGRTATGPDARAMDRPTMLKSFSRALPATHCSDPQRDPLIAYQELIDGMHQILSGLDSGEIPGRSYTLEDLSGYVASLVSGQRGEIGKVVPGSWGVVEDGTGLDSEARVDFVFRPTYIAAATLARCLVDFPIVPLSIDGFLKSLRSGLVFCSHRRLQGHGFEADEGAIDALGILSLGKVPWLLERHPDFCPELRSVMKAVARDMAVRIQTGKAHGSWGENYHDRFRSTLQLLVSRNGTTLKTYLRTERSGT